MAQRLYRIHVGRAYRRIDTEDHTNQSRYGKRQYRRERSNYRGHPPERRNNERNGDTQDNSDETTDSRCGVERPEYAAHTERAEHLGNHRG